MRTIIKQTRYYYLYPRIQNPRFGDKEKEIVSER